MAKIVQLEILEPIQYRNLYKNSNNMINKENTFILPISRLGLDINIRRITKLNQMTERHLMRAPPKPLYSIYIF